MLTVDFGRLRPRAGDRVLDLGCGDGRHAAEVSLRGAQVVALDHEASVLKDVRDRLDGLDIPEGRALPVRGDGRRLPFPDGRFDLVIATEVLEHVPDDHAVLAEITRVLAPGGVLAVSVPRWWPERICWALSEPYHAVDGGHVRIYRRRRLRGLLTVHGLRVTGQHHAHALHSPYWWLVCLLGEQHPACRAYHRFLCWDILKGPAVTKAAERLLRPVLGKSLVLYARKPC